MLEDRRNNHGKVLNLIMSPNSLSSNSTLNGKVEVNGQMKEECIQVNPHEQWTWMSLDHMYT
jgi:hypothetical protein